MHTPTNKDMDAYTLTQACIHTYTHIYLYCSVVVESIEKCVKMKKPDNKTYSISKHGITKVVRLFNEKPQSKPLTVCFNFPSMALTHLHILKLMRGLVSPIAGANVTG